MGTDRQELGATGEQAVVRLCKCPRCKRAKTLVRLPNNFKCADVICDFCGYLAQVKATRVADIDVVPSRVLGAAWGPQQGRMAASIYFPLFLVLVSETTLEQAIFYLPADLQTEEMFQPRKPLGPDARRAGWQGFVYDLRQTKDRFVRLA